MGNFEREIEAGKSTVLYCSVLYGAPNDCVYVCVCVCVCVCVDWLCGDGFIEPFTTLIPHHSLLHLHPHLYLSLYPHTLPLTLAAVSPCSIE